uniref:Uncharacterized protein n=1 Tax=Cucumis melo TaxID=3656 RepID=A0A9I9E8M1_CUCME
MPHRENTNPKVLHKNYTTNKFILDYFVVIKKLNMNRMHKSNGSRDTANRPHEKVSLQQHIPAYYD